MNNLSVCYLFGAGDYFIDSVTPKSTDFIIAVDGGYLWLKEHDIVPDLIVGDFDSMSDDISSQISQSNAGIITLPPEKDDTDMSAALNEGWKRGYRIFHIFGGTGSRLDHTVANIQLLADIAVRGGRCFLFDKDTVITAIHNTCIEFPAISSGIVSVFSHSDISSGVYEKGLMYPLTDATLRNTYPIGVSNEFVGAQSSISVRSGTLIVILPKEVGLSESMVTK